MNPTNWWPGIIALATAMVGATAYLLLSLRRAKPAGAGEDLEKQQAELEAQYQSIIHQLRELKAEQHHLSPEAYQSQRAELERRAADALRARDARALQARPGTMPAPATAAAAAAGTGFLARHPELKGAFWGGGVVAFFGLLGVLLFREGKPEEGTMDRGKPMQAQGPGQGADRGDDMPRALEHVREHPEDAEGAALVAHELIRRQDWQQAFQVTERALGADPFHVENRIHRAMLKVVRGDPAGEAELQHLADTYPGSQEALLFLATATMQAGDKARALDALERYVAVAPPEEQSIEIYQAMAEFRRELGRPPAP